MGSLASATRPTSALAPRSPPQFDTSRYRVLAGFCPKVAGPNTNVSNCIQCYNPSNNTWNHVSLIPDLLENHVLKGFAMVSLGESVYIIGGRLWNKGKPRNSSESDEFLDVDFEASALVLRYNVRLDQWSKCAPLGTPRYDFACCVCDNKIYVAGGKFGLHSPRGMSSAEVYDPAHGQWTTLPSMSTLRHKCVGVTWQGKIYVVGGFAVKDGSDPNMLNFSPQRSSAEVYDTLAEKWDLEIGMWQLDIPPNQIVAVEGKLFSSGDCLIPWKGHIEVYEGKLNIWNEVDGSRFNPPIPTTERLYLTMAPIGTQLYFFAGYKKAEEPSKTLSMVHIFDTSAAVHAWKTLEPMEEDGEKELCSHCCVVQLW
ncbi:hypothetical protein V6N13_015461 [Hibiscus sabdariffa]|uniref:Uncharacterized protein n=1 Tax=Hibiscus sabdariffa TaxID=183260 RepID=A0ABR2CVR7_9ROSI